MLYLICWHVCCMYDQSISFMYDFKCVLFFFEFLSLESISVLNDALSQIESQGSISMNSTNSRSVVSSAVDTVSTSVYQTCLNLAENLGHKHLLVISFYSSLLTAE